MSKMTAKIKKSPNKAIKKLEEIAKQMKGDNLVKVGLPKGSNNYPDGTSVIMVGNVHEFGSGRHEPSLFGIECRRLYLQVWGVSTNGSFHSIQRISVRSA